MKYCGQPQRVYVYAHELVFYKQMLYNHGNIVNIKQIGIRIVKLVFFIAMDAVLAVVRNLFNEGEMVRDPSRKVTKSWAYEIKVEFVKNPPKKKSAQIKEKLCLSETRDTLRVF